MQKDEDRFLFEHHFIAMVSSLEIPKVSASLQESLPRAGSQVHLGQLLALDQNVLPAEQGFPSGTDRSTPLTQCLTHIFSPASEHARNASKNFVFVTREAFL